MKRFNILVVVFISLLFFPNFVSAQTINDYKNKIAEIEKEKAEFEEKTAEVQAKIDAANARITEITNQIVETRNQQQKTKEEIAELQKKISEKEIEIKDLVAFYQISENDNFYLKFIFGAESFEDFIYRFSVAEQLTEANDKLVNEMNALVKENEAKVKSLEEQEKKLDNLNAQINKEIQSLGNEKKKYSENALDADDEIDAIEKQIEFYRERGCSDNEDVAICSLPKSVVSGGGPVSSTGFILPLPYGYVTSFYGGRIHPIYGVPSYHDGVDIAASTGTTVMASNSGVVIHADWYYGFGYAVLIVHNVNGNVYTTLYGHLSYISTSQGAYVTRGQKIGEVGSTGNSTGPHLHFQAMYGSGYGTTFDPNNLVEIPLSW